MTSRIPVESGDLMHLHEALDIAQSLAEWARTAHLSTDADRVLADVRIAAYTRIRIATTEAIEGVARVDGAANRTADSLPTGRSSRVVTSQVDNAGPQTRQPNGASP